MTHPAVHIKNLSHRYGENVALQSVTLRVDEGALFGLLGPNGSGKTTLFRILSTLLEPTSGQALVFDRDPARTPAAVRRQLGVIFQSPALDAELTVLENLQMHGALYGLHGARLRERTKELLHAFGLTHRAGDRIKTLSGGLKRRVDLVRGLLHKPRLLLLDEPTTGLDPSARISFWQSIERQRRQAGTTILVATHLMEEAERCDRVGIIDEGRLVAAGSPAELKAALGEEVLLLETDTPIELRDHLEAQFGLSGAVVGDTVQLADPEVHRLLPSLYEAFGKQISSAMIRQPTLEDVFMERAGHRISQPERVLD